MEAEKFDHSELTEDQKKSRGIETESEKEARVSKTKTMKAETKSAKKKSAPKAGKPAAKKGAAKPKATEKKKVSKPAKPKAEKKPAKPKKEKVELNAAGEPRQKAPFDPETSRGQKGPKKKIEQDDLNDNERAALTAIRRAKSIDLATLADRAFPKSIGAKKQNSRARNALRRLVRCGFVKNRKMDIDGSGRKRSVYLAA